MEVATVEERSLVTYSSAVVDEDGQASAIVGG